MQAYCTYAWDSGLKETVTKRWDEQKRSLMAADEDDPSPEETSGTGFHIPIDFKLKVAKEVYNSLSDKEKKKIDDRREKDRKQQYRSISQIADVEERNKKLASHQQYGILSALSMGSHLTIELHSRNQPSISKSLTRVFKNLEDQAGCVAHLFLGYIDPGTGLASIQK